MRAGLPAVALALSACASAPEVALCVRTAPDDRPFDGPANELVLRATPELEGGLAIQRSFQANARSLRLPTLDYGTWSFALEARFGGVLRAVGQTPFTAIESEDDRIPCLYFATVGTFGDTPAPPAVGAVRLAFSDLQSNLAFLATDEGLVAYDHETGLFEPGPELPLPGAGALWTALQEGRAAILTPDQGAVVSPNGQLGPEGVTMLMDVGPLDGAAAVFFEFSKVLLIGGAQSLDAQPERTLRIVNLASGTVDHLPSDLDRGLRDTRVVSLGNNEFVPAGGNEGSAAEAVASSIIAVIDLNDVVIRAATLDVPRRDAAIAVIGGNVLVFGGRGEGGALLDSIERFQVAGSQLVSIQVTHPLTAARAGALALPVGDAVLIVGGTTEPAEAGVTADRYTFEADGAVLANAPGVGLPFPAAVKLHDGTFLVVSGGGDGETGAAVVYRP